MSDNEPEYIEKDLDMSIDDQCDLPPTEAEI